MNSTDEDKAARIAKYKEERRKQLTARTATLFSSNVTERRKKYGQRAESEEIRPLKSTSEANLNSSLPSVTIRSTRASRLRAAATSTDQPLVKRIADKNPHNQVSSSDDFRTKPRKSAESLTPERDKKSSKESRKSPKSNDQKRDSGVLSTKKSPSSRESLSDTAVSRRSPRFRSNKSVGVSHGLVAVEKIKRKSIEVKTEEESPILSKYIVKKLVDVTSSSSIESERKQTKRISLDKLGDVKENITGKFGENDLKLISSAKLDTHVNSSSNVAQETTELKLDVTNASKSEVPKVSSESLLGAPYVKKVERFSELLTNLCSPCDAEIMFEDLVAENGPIEDNIDLDVSRVTSTGSSHRVATQPTTCHSKRPKEPPPEPITGTKSSVKSKNLKSAEAQPLKTDCLLSSSKSIPKQTQTSTSASPVIKPGLKPSPTSSSTCLRNQHRRRSSDNGGKPSLIPLAKKAVDLNGSSSKPLNKKETKKISTPKQKLAITSDLASPKLVSKDRTKKPVDKQNSFECLLKFENDSNGTYNCSKKRLTSVENSHTDESCVNKLDEELNKDIESSVDKVNVNLEDMSTLHESLSFSNVSPNSAGSRLMKQIDDIDVLTKKTLERVNKLSASNDAYEILQNGLVSPDASFNMLFGSTPEYNSIDRIVDSDVNKACALTRRGVSERLKDIDQAAQRLIDFERQSAINPYCDLSNDISSQNKRSDAATSISHTPISILKRKSLQENGSTSLNNHGIATPPVTFSPNVLDSQSSRTDRQKQGILKKRRSLDESQVSHRRSCSPEVSFIDERSDGNKSILKNRRSSLEDVLRTDSPDSQIHSILKRRMSREEERVCEDNSLESPEPHGILKRKSNSSSSSSTASSHVSIAQAVILAAAGGAEIVEEDKDTVRPILKKKSYSEERPSSEVVSCETPKPILKKKSLSEHEDDFDRPKKPILKTPKMLSSDDGNASSFDLSEDDRSSRRSSLLKSKTSDHSGSECETTVKPILKQRCSSLTRERSQSPRPRLSFCADNEHATIETNFSSQSSEEPRASTSQHESHNSNSNVCNDNELKFQSAVLRRRSLRPKHEIRSKSLACDVNQELLSILNNRRQKVDNREEASCHSDQIAEQNSKTEGNEEKKSFPSVAARIKNMEMHLRNDAPGDIVKPKLRSKTQPVTVDEVQCAFSILAGLEPSQTNFRPYEPVAVGSFPCRSGATGVTPPTGAYATGSRPLATCISGFAGGRAFGSSNPIEDSNVADFYKCTAESNTSPIDKDNSRFLDFDGITDPVAILDDIERVVNKVRDSLDEDSRALDEDEKLQAEADNWSLNVSCDSGVYNRASSRDSGPHSGEELGLIESQEIKENTATNSSVNGWSKSSSEYFVMESGKPSFDELARSPDDNPSDDEGKGFKPGIFKSNSVIARACMWQQMQQQAKGQPRPLLRHCRSKSKEGSGVSLDRFRTPSIGWDSQKSADQSDNSVGEAKSLSLDVDDEAKLDEDDPAKMSLFEKMKMFNSKLTHKPPVAGVVRKEDRMPRSARLRTMPVLASQVQQAQTENEQRMSKSYTQDEIPRDIDFRKTMELFRSASLKNASLEFVQRQNEKNKRLGQDSAERARIPRQVISPEVRGILKTSSTIVHRPTLGKGESSEGLKDEGIDSSSDDDSASDSSVSSLEKSSSDSSDHAPPTKPKRSFKTYQKNTNLMSSKTDSDIPRAFREKVPPYPTKIQLPCLNEMKDKLNRLKPKASEPVDAKPMNNEKENVKDECPSPVSKLRDVKKRPAKKIDEPIQLGKLRRSTDKPPPREPEPPLSIASKNQDAKNKFFGVDQQKKQKTMEELAAVVRKYIPAVPKSSSMHAVCEPPAAAAASGSDGESSGGREVRYINTRRHRGGGGLQKSATHAEMPHRGGTIAERLAALQAAGANDWRSRVCRLSPEQEDTKAIERAKNKINETLNQAIDEKKKVQIEDNELGSNILADRRTKLETAAQGWRKRVPQNDAALFSVAGRLERDKAPVATPPATPVASPGIPTPNKFRSRKQGSPPNNGFASGPLRSASCAVVSAASVDAAPAQPERRPERDAFKRSLSLSENISKVDEEGGRQPVPVPRADDETFTAFFASASHALSGEALHNNNNVPPPVDLDLDAIDASSTHLLRSEWAGRARAVRRVAASRNPLRALAARTDLRDEYSPPPAAPAAAAMAEHAVRERVVGQPGLAAEALAALASKEDFANVALRSAALPAPPAGPDTRPLMLLHVKGRRRVQTRLVAPVHASVNKGDCFVLVTPDQVYLYLGYYSNVIERSRASDIAQHIHSKKELGCVNSTSVITIDEQSKTFSNKHWNQFWSLLGVSDDDFKPTETGHADEDEIYESSIIQTNMCYEVLDDELVPMKEYWGQVPKIAMLKPNKVIVFDFGSELYTWYGKNVPLPTKRLAAQLAQELFDEGFNYEDCHINPISAAVLQGTRAENPTIEKSSKSRPEWAIIGKVNQHMESILFKEKFIDWPDFTRVIKVKHQDSKGANIEIVPCDAEEMFSNEYQEPDLILEGSHLGRGTGYYDKESMRHFEIKTRSVNKWIVQEFDCQKLESQDEINDFYSADSYIIRWEYQITVSGRELNGKPSKHNVTGRERCAYFYWQGKDASSNEKGAAALLTVELDKEKGPQVRVTQGNEPTVFLNIFQGNLVVHQGKRDTDKSRYKLFVSRGNLISEAYLLQVPCSMRQLRSRGSLVLADTEAGVVYVWHGVRSLKHTRSVTLELANRLSRKASMFRRDVKALEVKDGDVKALGVKDGEVKEGDVKVVEVKEGDEPKEVLAALGGCNRQFYCSALLEQGACVDVTPRLFHFTDLGGQFEAHEVLSPLRHETLVTPYPFEQRELYNASQPALFLLDDGRTLWLWQGWWPKNADGEIEEREKNQNVGAFSGRWSAMRAAALLSAQAYGRLARGHAGPAGTAAGAAAGTAAPSGPAAGAAEPADVRVLAAGLEPLAFTDLFDTWREHDDAAEANIAHGYKSGEALSGACELSRLTSCEALVPLAALQQRPLPEHVDPHHLERHLSPPDFIEAFGLSKEEFTALPSWKQTLLKKEVGLF